MRQLRPPRDEPVEPSIYLTDERPAPAGRPWLLVNMIATADGATAVADRSGPLGGPDDKAVFHTLRAAADVVLVGAGTVRAEGYGPARPRPDGTPGPRIAVVTRSGDLDPAARLFGGGGSDGSHGPVVVTCEACPPERRAVLAAAGAEVLVVGDGDVDLPAALAALRTQLGAGIVLCEGGPILNGELLTADLVDEWCLTVAPLLSAGGSRRAAVGPDLASGPVALHLDRLLEADGFLFARYLRAR